MTSYKTEWVMTVVDLDTNKGEIVAEGFATEEEVRTYCSRVKRTNRDENLCYDVATRQGATMAGY